MAKPGNKKKALLVAAVGKKNTDSASSAESNSDSNGEDDEYIVNNDTWSFEKPRDRVEMNRWLRCTAYNMYDIGANASSPGAQDVWQEFWETFLAGPYSFLLTQPPWNQMYDESYMRKDMFNRIRKWIKTKKDAHDPEARKKKNLKKKQLKKKKQNKKRESETKLTKKELKLLLRTSNPADADTGDARLAKKKKTAPTAEVTGEVDGEGTGNEEDVEADEDKEDAEDEEDDGDSAKAKPESKANEQHEEEDEGEGDDDSEVKEMAKKKAAKQKQAADKGWLCSCIAKQSKVCKEKSNPQCNAAGKGGSSPTKTKR